MGSAAKKKEKDTNEVGVDNSKNQVLVLQRMSEGGSVTDEPRQYHITELANLTGLNDEREIQRSLYILEGHKFVAPYPPGDFTSKTWHITKNGINALEDIEKAPVRL